MKDGSGWLSNLGGEGSSPGQELPARSVPGKYNPIYLFSQEDHFFLLASVSLKIIFPEKEQIMVSVALCARCNATVRVSF